MHDTLDYMRQEPVHRRWHHDRMTFGLMYAFAENFVLPLSHDEVVHGKGSLLAQDARRRVAAVRDAARLLRVHVGASGQEAAVHGPGVRAGPRVEFRRGARLAAARHRLAPRRAGAGARLQPRAIARSRAARARLRGRRLPLDRRRRPPTARCSPGCASAATARRRWPWSPTSRPCRATATGSACRAPGAGARSSTPTPRSTAARARQRGARRRRARRRCHGLAVLGDADAAAARRRCGSSRRRLTPSSTGDGGRDGQGRPTRRRSSRSTMAYVLAGGRGTPADGAHRACAPSPPSTSAARSRIIDFALSNALNSGIRRIAVATQYKAHSLIRHLQRGWNFLQPMRNESFDILPASQRVVRGPVVRGHRRRRVPEHRHHRRLRARIPRRPRRRSHLQDGLRAHARPARRTTAPTSPSRCLEVPVAEATRLRRDARRRRRPHRRRSSRSPSDPPEMPGPARAGRSPAWASTCSAREFLQRAAAARRRRPAFDARLRQATSSRGSSRNGKAVAHRFAQLVRALAAPRREPYWRDVGTRRRVLGGEHRPHRRRARARPLRPRLADLDLRRDHAAGEVRARRRRPARHRHLVAGVGRLHRLRRDAAPLAAVHRRARPFVRRRSRTR